MIDNRCIIIDCGSKNEKIYHSWSSSKDAGKKTTSINEGKDIIIRRINKRHFKL